jgi:hypothetical protein
MQTHVVEKVPQSDMMIDGGAPVNTGFTSGIGAGQNMAQRPQTGKSIFASSKSGLSSASTFPTTSTTQAAQPKSSQSVFAVNPSNFKQNFGQQNVFNPSNIFGSQNLLLQSPKKNIVNVTDDMMMTEDDLMTDSISLPSKTLPINYPNTSNFTAEKPSSFNPSQMNNLQTTNNLSNSNISTNFTNSTNKPQQMKIETKPVGKKEVKTLEEFEDEVRRMFEIPKLIY